jgi:bifunctional non-homologous end joining protein LigD
MKRGPWGKSDLHEVTRGPVQGLPPPDALMRGRVPAVTSGDSTAVRVGGRTLRLTNLDKVLYPATGTTKGEVVSYYAEVAPALLPLVEGRVATRKRWPDGVGAESFFEKNLPRGTPEWVRRVTLEHSDRDVDYPVIGDLATLTWVAQQGTLEIHVPQWRTDRAASRRGERVPDRLVVDLDPGEGVGLAECVEVALHAREDLHARDITKGAEPVAVTSGSKGLQLYVPLTGRRTSEQVSELAHELALAWERAMPTLVVSQMKKELRRKKVLVDWSQNNAAKTTVAPYSLRGRERPTAAAPRTWAELEEGDVQQLLFTEVLDRLRSDLDPATPLHGRKRR